jgi:hypothetical protein
MAFRLTCDVTACGAEIQASGAGQPTLGAKSHTYCSHCAEYIASVDKEMAREATIRGMALAQELDALRRRKIAEALPQQQGGTGLNAEWRVEVPEYGEGERP